MRRIAKSDIPDLMSIHSILSPAMQGSSDPRVEIGGSSDDITPIYSTLERQYGDNFMDSLSLRRDLTCMENPPFGAWWTYTIEETLVWPILEYDGDISIGLDALLELPDNDEDDVCTLGERSIQVGLDDGETVRKLTGNYLEHVHTQNPVLDPNELRSNINDLIENGLRWDDKTCQVVSITLHADFITDRQSFLSVLLGQSHMHGMLQL